MATFAVIVGLLFAVLGFTALVGLAAAKIYDWITSPRERT